MATAFTSTATEQAPYDRPLAPKGLILKSVVIHNGVADT
jgi:hypothetical protein